MSKTNKTVLNAGQSAITRNNIEMSNFNIKNRSIGLLANFSVFRILVKLIMVISMLDVK